MSHAVVPSPCNNVCRMDDTTGLCAGCLRTLDEIAAWGLMSDEQRWAVWDQLALRREQVAGADTPGHAPAA